MGSTLPPTCLKFASVYELLDATINGNYTEGVEPIITFQINGENVVVQADLAEIHTVQDAINLINASPAGQLVKTTVELVDNEATIVFRARSAEVQTLAVLTDATNVFHRAASDLGSTHIGGVTKVTPVTSAAAQDITTLEPKESTPALEQVYIPMHTEIVSNDPIVNVNYWFDNVTHSQEQFTYVGGIAAGNPGTAAYSGLITNEEVVYTASTWKYHIQVEARYASGANAGKLITTNGYNGRVQFDSIPQAWVNGRVDWTMDHAVVALGSSTGNVYVKSSAYAPVGTDNMSQFQQVVAVSAIDPQLTGMLWTKMITYDNTPTGGYSVIRDSGSGIAVDSANDVYVVFPIMVETGDLTYNFGVAIWKLSGSTGETVWHKEILPKTRTNNMEPSANYCPTISIDKSTNNLYVNTGESIIKMSSAGAIQWSIDFNVVDVTSGSAISDCVFDAETNDLFVAVSGGFSGSTPMGWVNSGTTLHRMDADTGNIMWTRLTDSVPQEYHRSGFIYLPVRLAVDNTGVYGVASFTQHGFDAGAAGMLTVFKFSKTGSLEMATDIAENIVSPQAWNTINCRLVSYSDRGQASIDVSSARIYVAAPRDLIIGNGGQHSSAYGDYFAIAKNVPTVTSYTSTTAAYDFSDVTAKMRWLPADYADMMEGPFSASTPTITNALAFAQIVDNTLVMSQPDVTGFLDITHSLPPAKAEVVPSLYVKNVAAVGQLQLLNSIPAPTSAQGSPVDRKGMVRCDAVGVWYCTGDYDGSTSIWKCAPYASTDAPRIRSVGPNYNPNNNWIVGAPSDRIGDLCVLGDTVLICNNAYDGNSNIWVPLRPDIGPGLTYSDGDIGYEEVPVTPDYPNGYRVTSYEYTISTTQPYDFQGFIPGKPASNAIAYQWTVTRYCYVTMYSNLGWKASVAATGTATFTIQKNGVQIGWAQFSAGSGVPTSYFYMHPVYCFPGDVIRIVAPATQDATLANIAVTIEGMLF